tara:strand:- start:1758 stop:2177 length:420 start_codon:yes stop_codon:yes gene_type:complete
MSCISVENSLFTLDTEFAGYYCKKNFVSLVSVLVFNSFMVLLSIFVSTRRHQEERRMLNVTRNTPEWNNHFWRFISLVGISNIIYIVNFLLLINSNFLQIVFMVLVRMFGYIALHKLKFVQSDFQQYTRVQSNEQNMFF